jgi:hypothetical protein
MLGDVVEDGEDVLDRGFVGFAPVFCDDKAEELADCGVRRDGAAALGRDSGGGI